MMWISLILKNGIKVVMWYSFVGYFMLKSGEYGLTLALFCVSGGESRF